MARSECFEDMMTCINSVQSTSIVYIYNHIDIYIYIYIHIVLKGLLSRFFLRDLRWARGIYRYS